MRSLVIHSVHRSADTVFSLKGLLLALSFSALLYNGQALAQTPGLADRSAPMRDTGIGNPREAGLTINGKVTNFEESFPLEGVSVRVKDTKMTTGTQADGTFSLPVSAGDRVLVISLEGYETQEVTLADNRTEYDIVLKRAANKPQSSSFAWMLKQN